MNITEETNQNTTNSSSNIFGFSPNLNSLSANSNNSLPWTQGPPQFIPWGHSPNSPPASLVTFSAQPPQMSADMQFTSQLGSFSIINNVNSLPVASTSNFGHNIITISSNTGPIASTSTFGQKPILHCKRKANLDINIPSKQHITEEKMAQHMSRLHISSESHADLLNLTRDDIEDSTIRQKRLYVCEEMRRLQTESILPSSLLGRLERPCMAVMLWQPPAKIPDLLGPAQLTNTMLSTAVTQANILMAQRQGNLDEDENENNAGTIDLNNMEMDS